jgi:hypothetical protein
MVAATDKVGVDGAIFIPVLSMYQLTPVPRWRCSRPIQPVAIVRRREILVGKDRAAALACNPDPRKART